jgi:hypothetical protein
VNNRVRPTVAQELSFRNALVTGNVIGGREFRGDVGYSAAGDFRGRLGSDDFFSFQRNSAGSAWPAAFAPKASAPAVGGAPSRKARPSPPKQA